MDSPAAMIHEEKKKSTAEKESLELQSTEESELFKHNFLSAIEST